MADSTYDLLQTLSDALVGVAYFLNDAYRERLVQDGEANALWLLLVALALVIALRWLMEKRATQRRTWHIFQQLLSFAIVQYIVVVAFTWARWRLSTVEHVFCAAWLLFLGSITTNATAGDTSDVLTLIDVTHYALYSAFLQSTSLLTDYAQRYGITGALLAALAAWLWLRYAEYYLATTQDVALAYWNHIVAYALTYMATQLIFDALPRPPGGIAGHALVLLVIIVLLERYYPPDSRQFSRTIGALALFYSQHVFDNVATLAAHWRAVLLVLLFIAWMAAIAVQRWTRTDTLRQRVASRVIELATRTLSFLCIQLIIAVYGISMVTRQSTGELLLLLLAVAGAAVVVIQTYLVSIKA